MLINFYNAYDDYFCSFTDTKALKATHFAAECSVDLLRGGGWGSADSSGAASSSNVITGVAAVGAPIDGTVALKDATGATRTAQTNPTSGEFSLNIDGLTPPFILRAQKTNGDFMYSATVSAGIANINPLSHVVMGYATNALGLGPDPNTFFQSFTTNAPKLTRAALDSATVDVYKDLSTQFKAKLGNIDVNPIYEPFKIGNALDKAFDETLLVYDASSGLIQEKNESDIKFRAFGTLGDLKNLSHIAGTYTGSVVIGSSERGILGVIDDSGDIFVYIEPGYILLGGVSAQQGATSLQGKGVMYLTLNGNSTYRTGWALDVSFGLMIDEGKLRFDLDGSIGTGSPKLFHLEPSVDLTYGNNLYGNSKGFYGKTLGPFDTKKTTFTNSFYSYTSYFTGNSYTYYYPSYCNLSYNSGSFELNDYELSLYYLELKEDLPACSGISERIYDAVGVGVLTADGLHAFLIDRSTSGNINYRYNSVSYKVFKPN